MEKYFPEEAKWLLWDRKLPNDGFSQIHATGQNENIQTTVGENVGFSRIYV